MNSILDFVLATFLIIVNPAYSLYKSLNKPQQTSSTRGKRYLKSSGIILTALLVLAVDWWHLGRLPAALGFDLPLSLRGEIGLVVAVSLIVIFGVLRWLNRSKIADERKKLRKKLKQKADFRPRTKTELAGYLPLALLLGAGWEILYRGYLLWFLVPFVGTIGGVCISSIAYGVGHGYKNLKQFLGSIAMAFLFTIAFAITHSLWWLMLIHAFLAVFGGLQSYFAIRANESKQSTNKFS